MLQHNNLQTVTINKQTKKNQQQQDLFFKVHKVSSLQQAIYNKKKQKKTTKQKNKPRKNHVKKNDKTMGGNKLIGFIGETKQQIENKILLVLAAAVFLPNKKRFLFNNEHHKQRFLFLLNFIVMCY